MYSQCVCSASRKLPLNRHLPIISPGANHDRARLDIKRKECDVHVAGGGEDAARLPVDPPGVGDQHAHLIKVLRHVLCPVNRQQKYAH